MSVERFFQRLQSAAKKPNSLEVIAIPTPLNIDALVRAPIPLEGNIHWTPPPSYQDFLKRFGYFHLSWNSKMFDRNVGVYLFNPEQIASASEIVYLPPGVSMGDGELSTNHLVPFAGEPGEEWAFCFDASVKTAEYPIYYNHQDTPRARLKSGGKWHDSTSEKPDFASFEKWLEWLAEAVEANKDPEFLGPPWNSEVFK